MAVNRAYVGQPIWNQRLYYEVLSQFTPDRRWLDLGCGRGYDEPMIVAIRRRMREQVYVGVDIDMGSLRDCREANRVCADLQSLPFATASFDLVSSNMVFEHLADPVAALREAYRVLDPRGVLIIHTASAYHYMLVAGRILSTVLPRETYRGLVSRYTARKKEDIFPTRYKANTAGRLSRAAAQVGFKQCVLRYLETPLDFPLSLRPIERHIRPVLPQSLKSTMLAVIAKEPAELIGTPVLVEHKIPPSLAEAAADHQPAV